MPEEVIFYLGLVGIVLILAYIMVR